MNHPPHKMAIAILGRHHMAGGGEPEHDGPSPEESDAGLHAAASDMLKAIHAKDALGMKTALRAFFDMCESEPHEEGPEGEP